MLQHTFTHPKGLLFATQFVQIALVVTSRAAFKDMHSKGLVQPGTTFAGHSLGGFSALTVVADILPNSSLVDIVFYCGLTMQHIVECDKQGHLNYAMDYNSIWSFLCTHEWGKGKVHTAAISLFDCDIDRFKMDR